jgi:hypothetical protein
LLCRLLAIDTSARAISEELREAVFSVLRDGNWQKYSNCLVNAQLQAQVLSRMLDANLEDLKKAYPAEYEITVSRFNPLTV